MKEITSKLNTNIEGLRLFKADIYKDSRGSFFRHWEKDTFSALDFNVDFVQDNISISHKDVLRGLHIQEPGYEQGKLVRSIQGGFLDVAVDLRTGSNTYGCHCKVELTQDNGYLFWIPKGFAHGFLSLSNGSIFVYKCDAPYAPEHDTGVLWNDKHINIDWKTNNALLSDKDEKLLKLSDYNFKYHSTKIA